MTDPDTPRDTPGDPLGDLLRWEEAGGTWHAAHAPTGEVTVALCRCDGGEEVDRIVSEDPELRVYVSVRPSSED